MYFRGSEIRQLLSCPVGMQACQVSLYQLSPSLLYLGRTNCRVTLVKDNLRHSISGLGIRDSTTGISKHQVFSCGDSSTRVGTVRS
ncbi:hypothetical protein BDV12DRAFT_178921 [Aspergillus spectabilis]